MRSQRSLKLKAVFAAGLVAGVFASTGASAQGLTINDLGLSEAQARALMGALGGPAATAGVAFGSPIGFGADWGEIGIGLGGQTLSVGPDDLDGSFSAAFGLGDANKYIGFEGVVNVISLRNSFGDDGDFAAKLHTVLPGRASFAVGVENIGRWGNAKSGHSSVYAVGTKFFDLAPGNPSNPIPLSLNVGIGDNRFQDIDFVPTGGVNAFGDPNGFDVVDSGAAIFGGIAIFPLQQLSLIADWTGRGLNLGVSAAPFRSTPLVISAGALNVTGEYQGRQFGDETEFGAGIGYTFSY